MKIAIGADHAGFSPEGRLRRKLARKGHEVVDFGTGSAESCDYPGLRRDGGARRGDRRRATAAFWSAPPASAWPWRPTRSLACAPPRHQYDDEVRLTREHNDANVLTLGAKYIIPREAEALVDRS